jgi:cytochrome c-type biogenesis protein CcmE
MEEEQNNKGQKSIWVGKGVVKHRGTMKHHAIAMHEKGVAKHKEQYRSTRSDKAQEQ